MLYNCNEFNKDNRCITVFTLCNDNYKVMEKSITINPFTINISTLAVGLKQKNELLKLGFFQKRAFVELVQEYYPKYKDEQKIKELHNWWYQRGAYEELNKEIDVMLNKLQAE